VAEWRRLRPGSPGLQRRGTAAIVLDPFGGSGTTLIACEKTGRQARLVELDPKYCDVICRRWQELTGGTATLESDGRSFAELAAERRGP
jgi:DNA modification methylase